MCACTCVCACVCVFVHPCLETGSCHVALTGLIWYSSCPCLLSAEPVRPGPPHLAVASNGCWSSCLLSSSIFVCTALSIFPQDSTAVLRQGPHCLAFTAQPGWPGSPGGAIISKAWLPGSSMLRHIQLSVVGSEDLVLRSSLSQGTCFTARDQSAREGYPSGGDALPRQRETEGRRQPAEQLTSMLKSAFLNMSLALPNEHQWACVPANPDV